MMKLNENIELQNDIKRVKNLLNEINKKHGVDYSVQFSDRSGSSVRSNGGILFHNDDITLESYTEHVSFYRNELNMLATLVEIHNNKNLIVKPNKSIENITDQVKLNLMYVVEEIQFFNGYVSRYKLIGVDGFFDCYHFEIITPKTTSSMN